MVMETPSPQCVGLEFVRQYYTVLNKAPAHLHRFFSHNSSYLHGDQNPRSEPIIGQADIHHMIMKLNFRDCHAKIRMVDAQATLGNGVVIQVTGELSNDGMPMRRFMQTFVLAPQTPKKYYVHNDIFRYQDDVFSDDEGVEEGVSEGEEEIERQVTSSTHGFPPTVNGTSHLVPEPEPAPVPAPVAVPVPAPVQPTPAPPAPAPVEVVPLAPTPPAVTPEVESPAAPEADDPWVSETDAMVYQDTQSAWEEPQVKEEEPEPQPVEPAAPISNGPKTYANLLKSAGSGGGSMAPPPSQPVSIPQPRSEPAPIRSAPPVQPAAQPAMPRPQPPNDGFVAARGRGRGGGGRGGSYRNQEDGGVPEMDDMSFEDRRRGPMVPDSHQIFVGNLPVTAGEDELKAEFSRFGKIIDIRINTAKSKNHPGNAKGAVPNFGFITFEEEIAVQKVMNAKPIQLYGDHRLNVEEKKARNGMGGGRPSSGRGGPMGGGGGSMRGGPGGGYQGRGGGRGGFNRDNVRGGPGGSTRGGFGPRR